MTDVFQQAREALAAFDAVFGTGTGEPRVGETVRGATSALRAVVDTAEDGHLIDTRRLRAAMVSVAPCDNGLWDWESAGRWEGEYATAADALAAAEREAGL